mmetsp:Transcript_23879/g.35278  ORF Transcript_23879/g.35278 Transcript_23879/m.35278 type:complete len:153 (-) Transcript_23879:170-628(-)
MPSPLFHGSVHTNWIPCRDFEFARSKCLVEEEVFVLIERVREILGLKFHQPFIVDSCFFDYSECTKAIERIGRKGREVRQSFSFLAAKHSSWTTYYETHGSEFARVGLDQVGGAQAGGGGADGGRVGDAVCGDFNRAELSFAQIHRLDTKCK